ncbi:MAG: hypothetical protein K2K09_00330, partial [Lachnospiraceae bacterium]|nr:hypothetical protein [Lachnospiraceae bacterium]
IDIWAQGRTPYSHNTGGCSGTESPKFKMLEKFDVLTLETRDQGLDNGDWEIAVNTYYGSPGYANQFIGSAEDKNGSSRFPEDVARLGMGEDFAKILETQYKYFHDTPNLMWDEGDYYSAEGYGTWSAAIQTALNQSIAPAPGEDTVIRVFPAWPRSWDAKYKLLAKGGFLVSSSMTDGDIEYVEIESQLGETCRIRNPWDTNITLYRNGRQAETIQAHENDLVTFNTVKGEDIVIVREGMSPEQYRTSTVIQ